MLSYKMYLLNNVFFFFTKLKATKYFSARLSNDGERLSESALWPRRSGSPRRAATDRNAVKSTTCDSGGNRVNVSSTLCISRINLQNILFSIMI